MKEKIQALGFDEEQTTKIIEHFKGYVPLERFNEVNEAKKAAESAIAERDKQLNELKKSVGDNEELKKQIETLQSENKASKEKFEAEIKTMKINNAVDAALTAAGAKNLKMGRALVDFEKIKLDGEIVLGLDEQIKSIVSAENSKFLFSTPEPQTPAGMKAPDSGNPNPTKPKEQMTYSERVASGFYNNN